MKKILIVAALLFAGWVGGVFTERVAFWRPASSSLRVQAPLLSKNAVEGIVVAPRGESRVKVSSDTIKADLLRALQETDYSDRQRAIVVALQEAQLEDIPALLDFANRLARNESFSMTIGIISRWAELDSPAAANFSQNIRREVRTKALRATGKEWAKKDPSGAKTWVASLSPGSEQNAAAIGVSSSLANENPATALQWIRQFDGVQRSYDGYSQIFRVWAAQDGPTAAKEVLALPPSAARGNAIYTTGISWQKNDPEAAFAWANNVPDATRRAQLMESGLGQWASKDPTGAIAKVLALPTGEARNRAITSVATSLAEQDMDAAQRLIGLVPAGGPRMAAMSSLVSHLASTSGDFKVAVEYALTLPPGDARNKLLLQVVDFSSLTSNPKESLAYLSAHVSDDTMGRQLIGSALQSWVQTDPRAAVNWAVQADPSAVDEKKLREAVSGWARMDAEDALAWTRSQPDGPRKAALVAGAIAGIVGNATAGAAELFSLLPPGPEQNNAAGTIAGEWARTDLNAAVSWTTKLPEGEARNSAIGQLVANWAEYDVVAAAKWLEGLPAGVSRDAGAAAYANKVIATDPEGGIAWAATISDGSQRENALRRCFEKWKSQDDAGAKRWLESTLILNQEAKQRLLAK